MKLHLYIADPEYCDYLRQTDIRVPNVGNNKKRRPFIGVLFYIDGIGYFAPLTSPKPKHLTMKKQVDFIKIDDGRLGAINLNNMLPIHHSSLTKIDVTLRKSDSETDILYKNLLNNQLDWCNANQRNIVDNAEKLYRLICDGRAWASLKIRCCDFKALEAAYNGYRPNLQH